MSLPKALRRASSRAEYPTVRPPDRPAALHGDLRRLEATLDIQVALQPIIDLSTGSVTAVEALARFYCAGCMLSLPVETTFARAYAAGRGPELEAACLRAALARRDELPAGVLLSVNVSPDALGHPAVRDALAGELSGVIVEVTEHPTRDSARLVHRLLELRRRGAAIAVDDASKAHSGLHRLAAIRPEIVKLDRTLVLGVRDSVEQTAVIEAIVSLCRRLDSALLGEGIERLEDLAMLAELDVDYGQGNAICPPQLTYPRPSAEITAVCQALRLELMHGRTAVREPSGVDGLRLVTAALAGSIEPEDLQTALSVTAAELQFDTIELSIVAAGDRLRQLAAVGIEIQSGSWSAESSTRQARLSGRMVEAHLRDPDLAPETRSALAERGLTSMLVAPLIANATCVGVLHLGQRSPTRWRARQITHARSLADHVALALLCVRTELPRPRIPAATGSR